MSNILEYEGRTFIIGSYAVHKALTSIGFSLSNIGEAIDSKFFDLINAVILYSAEYPFYRKGEPSDFKEADVYELLDATGGYNGKFIQDFTKIMMASINPGEHTEVKSDNSAKKKPYPLKKTA